MAAKRATKAERRDPAPPVYDRAGPSVPLGVYQVRLVALRAKRKLPDVPLDELVEHVDFTREGSSRTGEMNFRKPLGSRGVEILATADSVDLLYAKLNSTQWKRAWRMQVATPTHQLQEGIISVALKSALKAAENQEAGWKFRAGAHAQSVTAAAAKRFRVPIGHLAAGTHPLPKLIRKKASVVDIATWAYKEEREATGRRYDIDLSRGVLDVVELADSPLMLELGPAILDATLEHDLTGLASALIVTSTRKTSGSRKKTKLKVQVVDQARVKRYGFIVKTVDHAGLDSAAEAIAWGKAHLARMKRPKSEITFTHPWIPGLDRGQACVLDLIEEEGLRVFCWTKSVRVTLSAGSQEMEVTVGMSDPFIDARRERVKKQRAAAAAQHARGVKASDVAVTAARRTATADRRAAA